MFNIKTIIGVLLIVGIITSVYLLQDNIEESKNEIQTNNTEELKDETYTDEAKAISNYKDVFIEKNQMSKFEKMQDEKNIEEIKRNSQKLISEVDKYIKEKNLVLQERNITKEQKEKRDKQLAKLEALNKKLEGLKHEN